MTAVSESSANDIMNWGKEALETEAEALHQAAKSISKPFSDAVTTVLSCRGKAVIVGLGKSGHIARKISSTLASTGTPSFFLHPTEALHGDFGMITNSDCVIAIAFGGETPEVVDVVKYAHRLGVPIIAITGKPESTLAKLSNHVLDGRVPKEACPLNLAPTSSSTVAMALGDALAVALMRARGFTKGDFAALHPGGSLGKKLSLVKDLMHKEADIPKVSAAASFHDVLESVTKFNFGIAAVVDVKGSLMGAITDGDLRRALLSHGGEALKMTAEEVMTKSPRCVESGILTIEAFQIMEKNRITSLFVKEHGKGDRPVGLIRLHDLLAAKIV